MINNNIEIDFPIPRSIKYIIEDLVASYEQDGEDGEYMDLVDTLDNACKEYYVTNGMTKKQWELLMEKYGILEE